MDLTKGDILIIKKEPYPRARADDVPDAEYIVVYNHLRRCHIAHLALREGSERLKNDPEWNITSFNDDQIVMKLEQASTIHKLFVGELEGLHLEGSLAHRDYDGKWIDSIRKAMYRDWLLGFLKEEYHKYRERYTESLD